MDGHRVKVLCVDDNEAIVKAIAQKLAMERDFECVGRLHSADELIQEARRTNPDVVLLDIEMPGRDSLLALEELARVCPNVRTLILSAHVRDDYIDAAITAGAWGYVSKADPPAEIIESLRKVASGEFSLGREIAERHARQAVRKAEAERISGVDEPAI